MLKEKPLVKNGELPGSSPVFVVGVLRSGTSLLYALLNQHPQVALMYECDVWNFPEAFSGIRFKRDWLRRQEFYNQALSRHRLTFGDSLRGLERVRLPRICIAFSAKARTNRFLGRNRRFIVHTCSGSYGVTRDAALSCFGATPLKFIEAWFGPGARSNSFDAAAF